MEYVSIIIYFPGLLLQHSVVNSLKATTYGLHGGNIEAFLDVNSFRAADVTKRLDIDFSELQKYYHCLSGNKMAHMNMMLCPICKDMPDVIMDGTSKNINAKSLNTPSITCPWGN